MKSRKFTAVLLFIILMLYTGVNALAEESSKPEKLNIQAKACALIEQSTGRVLYSENGGESMPMASTTKVMTALVVLERAPLTDVLVIPKSASGIEGSSIYLEPDEKLTVEQLLYGLMLRSGNDAAVALAQYVGGSVEGFAQLMNDKAAELGLTGSHFVNPHGLPADNHYTTAIDMAKIMAAAMEYEAFRAIIATEKIQIPWEGHPWNRVLTNKNKLLTSMEGALGGKTGFTKAAGRCLVEACERNGMELISVVLSCPDWWNESEKLLDYGFENFTMEPLLLAGEVVGTVSTGGMPEKIDVVARRELSVPMRDGEEALIRLKMPPMPGLPIDAGQNLALAVAEVNGEEFGSVALCAKETVRANRYGDVLARIFGMWYNGN